MASRVQALRLIVGGCSRLVSSAPAEGALLLKYAGSAKQSLNSIAVRSVWTSPPSFSLAKLLQEEMKYEQDNYAKPEPVAGGPPAPFVLTEEPNDTLLTLKRVYNNEEVAVNLHVNNQPGGEGFDEDETETLSRVAFNVSVTKKDVSLVFECTSTGEDLVIEHVSHEPKDGTDSESVYTGPVFQELDENLQLEFTKYLETRGVNADLGEYLRHLVYDKEQKEYIAWLKKVREFVDA